MSESLQHGLHGCTLAEIKLKMETGEQAHTERAIQHPTFPFTQPAHRVLYPVGSLQYLFIMRVNVSELHGQFNNCICFAAVM